MVAPLLLSMLTFDQDPIGPTSLSVLPRLPSGAALSLTTHRIIGRDSVGLGGQLWPSAAALCRWLRSQHAEVVGSSVLELGCGTGAVGIYAAALGAASVTLTDGGDDRILQLAEANVAANAHLFDKQAAVRVEKYEWGQGKVLSQHIDLVLASDVTYARNTHAALCHSLRQIMDYCGARVVIAHEHRRILRGGATGLGAPARDVGLAHFCEAVQHSGLRVTALDVEAQAKYGLRDISLLEISL